MHFFEAILIVVTMKPDELNQKQNVKENKIIYTICIKSNVFQSNLKTVLITWFSGENKVK